jgi:hypothetical protein
MPWTCPSCGSQDNRDSELRCDCGYEYSVPDEIDYGKIKGALLYLALNIAAIIIVNCYYVIKYANANKYYVAGFLAAIFVLFPMVLLFKLCRKEKTFPKIMITYLVINILLLAVVYMINRQLTRTDINIKKINDSVDLLAISIFTGGIWIIYLKMSERVKNTFVN